MDKYTVFPNATIKAAGPVSIKFLSFGTTGFIGNGVIGFRCQVSGVSKPQILKPETCNLDTDLVAAEGLRWAKL